jgi:amino acid adenylation domain-containing protein
MENRSIDRSAWQNIQEIFESQVRQTPEAIALVYQDQCVTYAELNKRANRIAHRLRENGVGRDDLVGLYLDRSLEVVVALLAILKAGGAYVPLDPEYPKERLEFILQDTRLGLLVTRESLRTRFGETGLKLVCVDDTIDIGDPALEQNLEDVTGPEDLAYVIYTSGSTGQPKGVMVTHRNVVHLFQSTEIWFSFGPDDVWTMFHSYAFDFSVWEMWGALFYGGRLVVVPQQVTRSPEALYRLVADEKVTVLSQVPYVFYQFIKEDEKSAGTSLPNLRYVIFGGEALNFNRLGSWYERHDEKQPRLVNMYGITETTVHVTYRLLGSADARSSVGSMIGSPIPDLKVHVLDENMQPVLTGEVGEMFVGGAGLARGYLHRPDLNQARFIPDPFVENERLYRTGDMVKATSDGDMEYLGRKDDQVKIRGFRIEPGEVEVTLEKYPGIKDVVVVSQEIRPEEKQLVAFYTATGESAPSAPGLRRFLMDKLPAHMVPSRFIRLWNLPLTATGKVDGKSLKAGSFPLDLNGGYAAPRTAIEAALARLWSEMLGLEKVGIHDNFFELGGHSLLVLRLISRVRDSFGIDIPLKVVFDQPVLEDLSLWIEKAGKPGIAARSQGIHKSPQVNRLPLSYPQENIYFIQKLFPACRAYHGRSLIHFKGDVEVKRIEQSLAAMIQRHEIYRTTFHEENGQTYQVVHPAWSPALKYVDLRSILPEHRHEELDQQIALDLQVDFDLARLPLVHWSLYQTAQDEFTLLFLEHHLVHDGWSFNVFIRDWIEIYRSLSDGSQPVLPDLPIRFSDFACDQHKWIHTQEAKDQVDFWKAALIDVPPVLDIPRDRSRPGIEGFVGSNIRVRVPASLFASLKNLSREESATSYMTMLAAFYVLLNQYTGKDDLVVGSGIANRKKKEVENILGMFINTTVFRARLSPQTTFRTFLGDVRKNSLDVYNNQEIPFDKIVEAINPDRSLSNNPLFQIMFNFNDAPLQEFRFPGAHLRLEEGIDNGSSKVDLNVIVIPRPEQLVGTGSGASQETVMLWEYSTALFDRPRIARMIDNYLALLQNIVDYPDRKLSELSMLDDARELQKQSAVPLTSGGKDGGHSFNRINIDARPRTFMPPRTQVEADMTGIWKRVLRVDRVSMNDNFFELGGHSLLATFLLAEIEKEFGYKLPLHLIFNDGTVQTLATALDRPENLPRPEGCIPVQVEGTRPPFFCFSPSVIDIVTYHGLSSAIGSDQPFYALYAPGSSKQLGSDPPDLVTSLLGEIQRVQPSGPYYLGGYSSGGQLALKLASRLQAQGDRVGLVVLLDSFAPNYPVYLPWVTPRIYNFLRVVRRIQSYLWKFWILDWRGKRDLLLSGERPFHSRFKVWVDNRRHELHRPVRVRPDQPTNAEEDTRYRDCSTNVLLLRARQEVLGVYHNPTLGWGTWLHYPLHVQVLPGDHESILFGPRLHVVAGILKDYLGRANKSQPVSGEDL